MLTFEEAIKRVPEGYNWLIRSDEKRGYLANLIRKGFLHITTNGVSNCKDEEDRFATYADDPVHALLMSIERCNRYLVARTR